MQNIAEKVLEKTEYIFQISWLFPKIVPFIRKCGKVR